MEHNDYQALEHAIAKHTALEHVLTHTRDAVIAAQRKELEKMRRELDRLNYSHRLHEKSEAQQAIIDALLAE